MKKVIDNVSSNINDFLILKIFKGVILSIIITLILLFVLSSILTFTNISEDIIPIAIIIISSISILIGSLFTVRKMKKNGIVYGGIIGSIYIISLYFISSVIGQGFKLSIYSIIMIIFCIICGMIGGIVGINIKI